MLGRRTKKRVSAGFTLIEVVIALLLLGMVGAGLVTTLNSTLNAKDTVNTISDRFHLARQAMERMNNEISMAFLSSQKNISLPVSETKFVGEQDKIAFAAFGHVPHIKNVKESDQREISFFLGDDEKTGKQALKRKIRNNISQRLGEEGREDVLCPDVKSLTFKYWDDKNQLWNDRWTTDGIEQQRTLPSRVLIELVVNIREGVEQKLMTETEIWLTKPISIVK